MLKIFSDFSLKKRVSSVLFNYDKFIMLDNNSRKPQNKYSDSLHFEVHIGAIDKYYRTMKLLKDKKQKFIDERFMHGDGIIL